MKKELQDIRGESKKLFLLYYSPSGSASVVLEFY